VIRIGREALRCLLARRGITFQRTKTWKESPDNERHFSVKTTPTPRIMRTDTTAGQEPFTAGSWIATHST
jgi:hypothetical protein